MRRLVPASLLAISLVVALSACFPGAPVPTTTGSGTASPSGDAPDTPTPEPEPETAPARADLALSPDGMGTLVFGEAPSTDPAMQMLVLDTEFCTDANTGYGIGIGPGDAAAALWVPIPAYRDGRESDFGVHVEGAVLDRIDLLGEVIPTTAGIRIGDARAAVEAAYPGAAIIAGDLTDIYVVTGSHGTLQIEVSTTDPYWAGFRPANVVVYIHAVQTGVAPFTVVASENIAGNCPF